MKTRNADNVRLVSEVNQLEKKFERERKTALKYR